MNYKEFAKRYLDDVGAYKPESNYGGMLGEAIMALVEAHSAQGHSGMSSHIAIEAFYDLNRAYSGEGPYKEKRSKIWDEYWASPEGQKLQATIGSPGIMDKH